MSRVKPTRCACSLDDSQGYYMTRYTQFEKTGHHHHPTVYGGGPLQLHQRATMADIEDLIAQLQNPGDDGLPDTIYDDLRGAHTSAIDGVRSSAQAKLEESNGLIAQRDEEINHLKRSNWDLFEQVGKAGDDGTPSNTTGSVDESDVTLEQLVEGQE